jgi:hypothetical protein
MSVVREEAVFLTDLLTALGGEQNRFGRYAARTVILEGRRYEKALVTDVRNRPSESGATLIVPLDRRFRTFRATVGRDPSETAGGPACVYFEVWGDDRRLFQSQALRSSAHLVKVAPGAGGKVRRTPQEVSVDVRGVRELRLVTRYADDFVQQAPQVEQGRGCVWGDPRLEPDAAAERTAPTVPAGREAPLRDALRGPALRLAVMTAGTLDEATRLPMRLAVAPLRLEGMVLSGPSEPAIRTILVELLAGARRGSDILFAPVGRRESEQVVREVPARRPERAEEDEIRTVTEAARRVNAEVVLTGTYLPASQGEPGKLTLTLLDVRSGAKRAGSAAVVPLP